MLSKGPHKENSGRYELMRRRRGAPTRPVLQIARTLDDDLSEKLKRRGRLAQDLRM
ncbi:unnamed protein product [Chondrus crispus]|uniref:Uncharacterized protein n=1 Tax=Chondrus crispus TaxID=2769 RepID=R7QT86_CHOCR|nr:unnamed protein product [Chondrus crispus]CDF40570.1 unnamed protein product [Chondrus crispus]|eukprot:XP_005710864.1 unnamed protein product [Chondrus crispus]